MYSDTNTDYLLKYVVSNVIQVSQYQSNVTVWLYVTNTKHANKD